jgi:hypothetical protein
MQGVAHSGCLSTLRLDVSLTIVNFPGSRWGQPKFLCIRLEPCLAAEHLIWMESDVLWHRDRIRKTARKLRKILKNAPKRPTAEQTHHLRTNIRRLSKPRLTCCDQIPRARNAA